MRIGRVRLSLQTKLVISFLLVLLPILGLIGYDYAEDYRQQERAVLAGENRTAQALGTVVDDTLDQAVAVGQALAADPTIQSLDPERLSLYLARYLSIYPHYLSINVWNVQGDLVGAALLSAQQEPRANIADRPHFQRAMATGRPAISEVIVARVGGIPSVAVAVPIHSLESLPIGVVTITLDLQALSTNLRAVRLDQGEDIFVADSTGRLALHTSRPVLSWEERDVSWYPPVQQALASGSFVNTVDRSIIGDPRLVAAARTPRHQWVAGVSIETASTLGPIQETMLAKLGIYGLLLLLAGLVAVALTYTITQPLKGLSQTIIAFGQGDLGRRARVQTGDELETTAEAFNRMASSLQQEQNRLSFLVEMGTELSNALQVDRITRLLAERSATMLGEGCWVCLCSLDQPGQLNLNVSHSDDPASSQRLDALVKAHAQLIANELFMPASRSGRPVLFREIEASTTLPEAARGALVDSQVASMLVVPLASRGRTLGALAYLRFSRDRPFEEQELLLATDIGGRVSAVIDNALLFQEVQEEQNRLRTLLDTAPVGVVVAESPGGRITIRNRMAEELLGSAGRDTPQQIDQWQQGFAAYRPDGESYPSEETPLARTLASGETIMGEEVMIRHVGGRELSLLVHSAPLLDGEGRLVGGVAIFQDITPLKEIQRQLEELGQAREEFISVVAHDLRSPLTVIQGFASFLMRTPPELLAPSRIQRAVENILSSTERQERMIADLLDASRIEARRLTINVETVELSKLVREVAERMQATTERHWVRVETGEEIPPLQADPARLEQVLVNLITNAAKYSHPDTEILVSVEKRAEDVMVSVTNQGQGIPPEEQESIFGRFRRAQTAIRSKTSGLGLGLYICRGLVEAHGGRIWVESQRAGPTTFRFTLPLSR